MGRRGGLGEGLLFRSSPLSEESLDAGGAMQGRKKGDFPRLQAGSARKQEGLYCISAQMRAGTNFSPYFLNLCFLAEYRNSGSGPFFFSFRLRLFLWGGRGIDTDYQHSTVPVPGVYLPIIDFKKSLSVLDFFFSSFFFLFTRTQFPAKPTFPVSSYEIPPFPSQRTNLNPCGVVKQLKNLSGLIILSYL